jgi:lipopolysaccharide transport protein LptA
MIRRVGLLATILAVSSIELRAQGSAPATLNREKSAPAAESPAAKPREKPKKKENAAPGVLGGATKPGEAITTQIYADQAAFDSAKYVGVFTGHVVVNDPRFNVQSDKLTVYLHKGDQEGETEGLDRAIAEGNVGVVRDRPDPNGGPPQRAIGRADKAFYNAKDGTVELSGSPRVQQGVNSHVATSADTVMLMNQNGELTTHGPSRTELRQEPKASPSPTPAATASPIGSPSP